MRIKFILKTWVRVSFISVLVAAGWVNAQADDIYWTNSAGGNFSMPANWFPNAEPGLLDSAIFTNFGSYGVTVDVEATNSGAYFLSGTVSNMIFGTEWNLTDEYRIGEGVNSTSRVSVLGGILAVTNSSGNAILSVGRNGLGELAINGADVITDHLTATNSTNSLLTLVSGSLTSLHGTDINNGKVVVGTVSGSNFVWNISGGNNTLNNDDPFAYGGLTLGPTSGKGNSTVNLSGSNTILTVNGLDVYNGDSLYISGGATFHTVLVQWGLISPATSNTVVISDPGSSWVNDYLMYFGMHAGQQTMIITNGGSFRTGGTTYDDQEFTALDNSGNRIIITGTNSSFYSDGGADFGIIFCTPTCQLDNLVLITNGGSFGARSLRYGAVGTSPGTIIDVADGTLNIGALYFVVGTLQLEAGTGTIDQMSMTGGSNAVLKVQNNLFVGHEGD